MNTAATGIRPVFLLCLVVSACTHPFEDQEAARRVPSDLLGPPWKLAMLIDNEGTGIDIPEGHTYDVHFISDSTLTGNAHCNTFSTSYTAKEEGYLSTGPVSSSLVLCAGDSPIMVYLEGIDLAYRYAIEDGLLHIDYGEKGRMTFVRAVSTP